MEHEYCAICDLAITEDQESLYVPAPRWSADDFGKAYHSVCYQARADVDAARRALQDFEKRGGTSLEDLRKELGL